jgi:hypothetical protein
MENENGLVSPARLSQGEIAGYIFDIVKGH